MEVGTNFFFHLGKNLPPPSEAPSTGEMPVQELGVGLYHIQPAHRTPKEEEKGVELFTSTIQRGVMAMGVPKRAPGTVVKQSWASRSVNQLSSLGIAVIPAFLRAK